MPGVARLERRLQHVRPTADPDHDRLSSGERRRLVVELRISAEGPGRRPGWRDGRLAVSGSPAETVDARRWKFRK